MNRKQVILLIIVGVVVGGLGLYSYKSRNNPWQESSQKLGQKVIQNFPMNEVERIAIKAPNGQLDLAKRNDTWTVQQRADYPANFDNVSEFLRKVWDLKVGQTVEVGPSRLDRFDLLPPDKGAHGATLVEFKDKNGKTVNSLLLGKKHMRENHGGGGDPFGGGGGGGYPD